MWGPDLWTRFDWTYHDGTLYFCMATYDSPTEFSTLSVPDSDPTSPADTDCRGDWFWTALHPM